MTFSLHFYSHSPDVPCSAYLLLLYSKKFRACIDYICYPGCYCLFLYIWGLNFRWLYEWILCDLPSQFIFITQYFVRIIDGINNNRSCNQRFVMKEENNIFHNILFWKPQRERPLSTPGVDRRIKLLNIREICGCELHWTFNWCILLCFYICILNPSILQHKRIMYYHWVAISLPTETDTTCKMEEPII
jgi:hypothetical protein